MIHSGGRNSVYSRGKVCSCRRGEFAGGRGWGGSRSHSLGIRWPLVWLLPVVMKQIKDHKGGNNFKVAHAQIWKQMHEEGYPDCGW